MTEPSGPGWERLTDQMSWYSQASRSAKRSYQRVKMGQLFIGASVPVVAGLGAAAWLTATLAALVVVGEGVQQLYGWQANWLLYRGVLQALKREKFLFLATAEPYDRADRERLLATRTEALMAQENVTWLESRRSEDKPKKPAQTSDRGSSPG